MMWRVLLVTLIFFVSTTHSMGNGLKLSLEYLNLTYYNEELVDLKATAVAVSKSTTKIRASGTIKYELSDNFELHVDAYKIIKNNKQYLVFRGSRTIPLILHLAETEYATDLRSHIIPDLYWPITPNVKYTLRDWWIEHSQCPFVVPAGRYKGIGTLKYPNNTLFAVADAVVNVFHSAEDFD